MKNPATQNQQLTSRLEGTSPCKLLILNTGKLHSDILLAELASESPDAQRKKTQCQGGEAKEVGPKIAETAALNQGPAHDGRKVMDRVQDGQRLHPFRHALDGVQ